MHAALLVVAAALLGAPVPALGRTVREQPSTHTSVHCRTSVAYTPYYGPVPTRTRTERTTGTPILVVATSHVTSTATKVILVHKTTDRTTWSTVTHGGPSPTETVTKTVVVSTTTKTVVTGTPHVSTSTAWTTSTATASTTVPAPSEWIPAQSPPPLRRRSSSGLSKRGILCEKPYPLAVQCTKDVQIHVVEKILVAGKPHTSTKTSTHTSTATHTHTRTKTLLDPPPTATLTVTHHTTSTTTKFTHPPTSVTTTTATATATVPATPVYAACDPSSNNFLGPTFDIEGVPQTIDRVDWSGNGTLFSETTDSAQACCVLAYDGADGPEGAGLSAWDSDSGTCTVWQPNPGSCSAQDDNPVDYFWLSGAHSGGLVLSNGVCGFAMPGSDDG